ncbi:MAG: hypothetical protein ABEJ24_00410 [Candidatus Magasanikbacteria bacterium]
MRKIVIITISLTLLFPFWVEAQGIKYTDQQDHYSFSVPKGWTEIPKEQIEQLEQNVQKQFGGKGQVIDYKTGFQPKSHKRIRPPHIIVQVQKHKSINTPSYSQIKEILQNKKPIRKLEGKSNLSELLSNAEINEPIIDKERNIVLTNMETNLKNGKKLKMMMVMFLGKKNITQLNFYSLKSEYSKNLPIFKKVIDSFKYEQGYKYNLEQAKKNDPPSIFEGMTEAGIKGLIGGVLLALVGGLVYKSKSK